MPLIRWSAHWKQIRRNSHPLRWRYKRRIQSLKEGIYECEPGVDGVFTWINQAGAEILGYNTPEEVTGIEC